MVKNRLVASEMVQSSNGIRNPIAQTFEIQTNYYHFVQKHFEILKQIKATAIVLTIQKRNQYGMQFSIRKIQHPNNL